MESTSYSMSKTCELSKKTKQKLGRDNLSEPSRNELIQVNGNLAEATKEYFKYKLIVDCVKMFLDQKVEEKLKNKEQVILSDPLYLTVVKKYSSADSVQPFGITEDFINKTISRKQKSQKEKEELNQFVEDEIDNFCVKISEYTGFAQRYRGNPQKAFRESIKDLSSELDRLADAKCKLESDEEEINDLISNYFENLMQGVSMLKSLVSLHEKKLEFHSVLGDFIESKQRTMASKIDRFEYRILAATYHKRSIEALTKIRVELDEKKVALDNDLNTTNSELHAYCILGPQYKNLVDEYTDLLNQIQHQKWAIESLKRRQSFGGPLLDKEKMICSLEQEAAVSSKLVETVNCATPGKSVDCSESDETLHCTDIDDTVFCTDVDETVDCTDVDETLDCTDINETVDCTGVDETLDCTDVDETVNCTGVDGTLDCTDVDETENCTGVDETLDCTDVDETENCTDVEQTLDCSNLDEPVDCTTLEGTLCLMKK